MYRDVVKNLLLKITHEHQRNEIISHFPSLKDCQDSSYLSIINYIHEVPQQFYSENILDKYLRWLQVCDTKYKEKLQSYIVENEFDISQAILHLGEINSHRWNDYFKPENDFELIRFIDQKIHPAYLRLIESVFSPLLHVVSYFYRESKGKNNNEMGIWNIVQDVAKTDLSDSLVPYEHLVRNGIAHGNVEYINDNIRYTDNKNNSNKYGCYKIISTYDEMLDVCNALSLGLSIFLLNNKSDGYFLPSQILLNELKVETKTPWWSVQGYLKSEQDKKGQLVIFARCTTADTDKARVSAFQTGVLAEEFAKGFGNYFISITSPVAHSGFISFDGDILKELRFSDDAEIEDYSKSVLNGGFFYFPKFKFPKFIYKIQNYIYFIKTNFKFEIYKAMSLPLPPSINIRSATIHRNSWGDVLSAYVTIDNAMNIDKDLIKKLRKKIVRKSFKYAKAQMEYFRIAKYLPLGYATIHVFQKNYRKRHLESFGLKKDLVCTIRVKKIRRIQSPDIFDSEVEIIGGFRIAWNKAWLESLKDVF